MVQNFWTLKINFYWMYYWKFWCKSHMKTTICVIAYFPFQISFIPKCLSSEGFPWNLDANSFHYFHFPFKFRVITRQVRDSTAAIFLFIFIFSEINVCKSRTLRSMGNKWTRILFWNECKSQGHLSIFIENVLQKRTMLLVLLSLMDGCFFRMCFSGGKIYFYQVLTYVNGGILLICMFSSPSNLYVEIKYNNWRDYKEQFFCGF